MPVPIGTVWGAETWADDTFGLATWGNAAAPPCDGDAWQSTAWGDGGWSQDSWCGMPAPSPPGPPSPPPPTPGPDGWTDLGPCDCCGSPYPYYPYYSGGGQQGEEGTIETGCCPGILLKTKLYGTLVNATGNCGSYSPQSWEFNYIGSGPTGHFWQSTPPPSLNNGFPGVEYELSCQTDGLGNYNWFLGYVAPVSDCQVSYTASCDPLMITFDMQGGANPSCSNDDFGGRLCNGTYQIIITE